MKGDNKKNMEKKTQTADKKDELQKLKEENLMLQRQSLIYQELHQLQNDNYFRQQLLTLLERIAISLENLLESSESIGETKSEEK